MFEKKLKEGLRKTETLTFVFVFLFIALAPYIYIFARNGLSECTEDWAHFGSYIGGVTAIIAVWLAYKTYSDQQSSNHREHFDGVFYRKIEIIKQQQREYSEDIKTLSDNLLEPFGRIPSQTSFSLECPIEDYESALRRCYNYYTYNRDQNPDQVPENYRRNAKKIEEIEELLGYIGHTLLYIKNDSLIDDKRFYVLELETILHDEIKTILFFYVVSEPDVSFFTLCKWGSLFKWHSSIDEYFLWVVEQICNMDKLVPRPPLDYSSFRIDDGKDGIVASKNYIEIVDVLSSKANIS